MSDFDKWCNDQERWDGEHSEARQLARLAWEHQQARIDALEKAAHALCASIQGSGGINPDTAAASIAMLKVLEAEK